MELDAPFQMQISQLDYNSYVGVIGIGRIKRGAIKPNQPVTIIDGEGKTRQGRVGQVLGHLGLHVMKKISLMRATSLRLPVR